MTYQTLIDSCGTHRLTNLRDTVALTLMYRCGLTVSEVCELPTDSVDLDGMVLHVAGGRSRTVPIPNDILPLLNEWQKRRPDSSWWVCTTQGTVVAPQWYRRVVRGLCDSTGVTCSPIELRIACAREWLKVYSPDEVVKLMGYRGVFSLAKALGMKRSELRRV